MGGGVRFEVIVDERVEEHLLAIDRRARSLVLNVIERQLVFEATTPARNRKPTRNPNTLGATWELRCGTRSQYRVFYDVDADERLVIVLAIGQKIGNRLRVGGEEFVL
jgi:mRNA-degrading endonuclease RelE of RelBE toxin-antitoxin system